MKSERTVGLAALLRGNASTTGSLVKQYDERDAGLWHAEYAVFPKPFLYLHRALRNVCETLESLEVDADAMRENMEIHEGLVTSEAVMMDLAASVGRLTTHEVVYEAATDTLETNRTFEGVLLTDERISEVLSMEELSKLVEPTEYIHVSAKLAKRTVDESRRRRYGDSRK
jgi:3-carboxy-cis,cis-muconate cycloisomerase